MKHCGTKLFRLLAALICLACLWQNTCFAAESAGSSAGQSEVSASEEDSLEEFDPNYEDDPDYLKRFGMMDTGLEEDDRSGIQSRAVCDPYTGLTYTHSDLQSGKEIIHGIDVSKWQGTIDWEAVKADGIEYVFIRCGYTSTGEIFYTNEDTRFQENIVGAYNAGLKVGIYYFSQATTVAEAQKEAEKTCKLIESYRDMITMPVVCDFEKEANKEYRANGVTQEQGTQDVLTFCNIVAQNGYTAYYYGSSTELPRYYDLSALSDYGCWIARYRQETTYSGDYDFWQYSSDGRVDGISGAVDCNFWYVDALPGQVTGLKKDSGDTSSITLSWNSVSGATQYEIAYSKAKNGTLISVDKIPATKTSYKVTGLSAGTGYYFVVRACNNNGVGEYSAACGACTTRKEILTLYTKCKVNLRKAGGLSYGKITTIPKNTMLDVRYQLKDVDGNTWYNVSYTVGGKTYTGYVHGGYVAVGQRAKPTEQIYLRTGAGKNYSAKTTVKPQHKLILLSSKKDAQGNLWYKVYTQRSGKVYIGYCMGKYIKKY